MGGGGDVRTNLWRIWLCWGIWYWTQIPRSPALPSSAHIHQPDPQLSCRACFEPSAVLLVIYFQTQVDGLLASGRVGHPTRPQTIDYKTFLADTKPSIKFFSPSIQVYSGALQYKISLINGLVKAMRMCSCAPSNTDIPFCSSVRHRLWMSL